MIKRALGILLNFAGRHTQTGRRISSGIRNGKVDKLYAFKEVESSKMELADSFLHNIQQNGLKIAGRLMDDSQFLSCLKRFAQKNKLSDINFSNMSKEEILEMILHKSGIGPCKFAQMISSEKEIMRKLTPELQEIIKKTQSENPFSRTLEEAQEVVNAAFNSSIKRITSSSALEKTIPDSYKLVRPLSAGTVGEAYLGLDANGKEVIIKMIKKGVDAEELELEKTIITKLIREMAPDSATGEKLTEMLNNLYKNWSKELDFSLEYNYNKILQQGAKRFKVADITHISADKTCIIMDKAEGIQMNELMKMLRLYKDNPKQYYQKYADIINKNPWLSEPEKVIKELPECITKSFDEMFLFMKKDGSTITHGDPHMGNYFITATEQGSLLPVYIDTGCCIRRNSTQIKQDIQFLSNYFVGNSKGLAEYFITMCESSNRALKGGISHLLTSSKDSKKELIEKLAQDIQKNIFDKRHNVTDVDAVQKTIQNIMEKYGLTINPEESTALKAQMQFYTSITEAAALSGKTINVGTIIKDIPEALWCMIRAKFNPIKTVSPALNFSYCHQEQSSRIITQFLTEQPEYYMKILQGFNSENRARQIVCC